MKTKKMVPLAVFLLLLAAGRFNAQPCNLLCNGSFESPFYNNASPAPVSSYFVGTGSQSATCWQSLRPDPFSPPQLVGGGNLMEYWFSVAGPPFAFGGGQFLELQGWDADPIWQNFNATAGSILTIGFAHRGRSGVDVMKVEIGPTGGSLTNLGNFTDGNTAWGAYSAAYTVGSTGSHTIKFTPISWASLNTQMGNFLDAVTVTQNSVSCAFNVTPQVTQPTCTNTSSVYLLTSNNGPTYTYQWSSGSGNTASVNNLAPGVYQVTVTANCGCASFPVTSSFTINPVPPIPVITVSGTPLTRCAGIPVTLTASGANTYLWWLPGPTVVSGNPINVNPTVGGTYSVFGTNQYGCIGTGTIYVPAPLTNPVITVTASPVSRCLGTPVSITASGASTYLWLPSNWTGNPYSVNPTGATTYTVIGTAANGCTSSAVYNLVAPQQLPTINIIASSTLICAGYPNTLTASGAHSYNWWPSGGTANPVIVNPTSTTVYYAFGTNTITGCQSFATVTITPGTAIPLSVQNSTYCNNATSSTPLTVSTTFNSGPVNYTWLPGTLNGQNVNVSPNASTVYTVYATSPNGCPASNTLAVTVVTNCCTQPTTGLTLLNSAMLNGPLAPGSYFINSNVTLGANTTLSSSEFLFMPGTKLTVPPGLILELDEAHLFACGVKMWEGIEIRDGGRVITSTRPVTSLIEDAQIGIDLNNISPTNSNPNPPIDINKVVFNKNYIGIRIANSDVLLNTLALAIDECVFTSRDMLFGTYPSVLSWPSANNTFGNLRAAALPTTGLAAPYDLQNFTPINIKGSCHITPTHGSQTGHIGIDIENIGNLQGSMPSAGIDIGYTFGGGVGRFNLFDGLGAGFYVEDASLSTVNNVFQNMSQYSTLNGSFGGWGIRHITNSLMNCGLNLTPNTPATDYGNRFWDNWTGVYATNLYSIDLQYGLFRSNHVVNPMFGPGSVGVSVFTNRFDNNNISFNEFNNIAYNIWFGADNGSYDVGGINNGTYAGKLSINQNYIGPEVNSLNPVAPGSLYSNYGITLWGMSAANWNITGNCEILSNKLDRVYRGIQANSMDSYPIEIGGNNIRLVDDYFLLPTTEQYGIYANRSTDNMFINLNDITGDGPVGNNWNQRVRLVLSENNTSLSSNISPKITCNTTTDGYIGFEFDGPQPFTEWTGNDMNQRMHIGLSLINNGQVGTQGNPTQACNDEWNDLGNPPPFNWVGSGNWQTFVDNSSTAFPGSFLWCNTFSSAWPVTNGGGIPFSNLSPNVSIGQAKKGSNADCFYLVNYPTLPNQRGAYPTGINVASSSNSNWMTSVFPNPSNGEIEVKSNINAEILDVKVTDITGKVTFTQKLTGELGNIINLKHLPPSIYIIEIKGENNKTVRKKLIITD
ncbi:T9SS type A sorting domain-containing protein [Aurantibacillus circumpalustris]|uniref:T9SS type A sorting domain-containing protein n=1 Tax=Aurantibacillus circumpalustris TaxID=3036359 RepID=UPI00295BFE85|nr:T9SS type A sorting domain-containing protein [Aurantibacillus circumpalustris]